MISYLPLEGWASKDLHALLSCKIGFGHLSRRLDISNSAGNELGAALKHDDAGTGFLPLSNLLDANTADPILA